MQTIVRPKILDDLRERIHQIERTPQRAEVRGTSTGFADLDGLLAHGGLQHGTLIEWLGESVGA